MAYEDMLTAFLVDPEFITEGDNVRESLFLGAVQDLTMPEITARRDELVDGFGNSELGPLKGLNLASRQMSFNMREMHKEVWQHMFQQRKPDSNAKWQWLIYGSLGSDRTIGETRVLAERQLKITLGAAVDGMDTWQMASDTVVNFPIRLYLSAIKIEQAVETGDITPGDPETLINFNWDTGVFLIGGDTPEFDLLAARRANLGLT